MNDRLKELCSKLLGEKKFELLKALCEKADENFFIFCKIDDLVKECGISKPTIIATFKLLEEKKLLTKLKNGLYKLNLDKN